MFSLHNYSSVEKGDVCAGNLGLIFQEASSGVRCGNAISLKTNCVRRGLHCYSWVLYYLILLPGAHLHGIILRYGVLSVLISEILLESCRCCGELVVFVNEYSDILKLHDI